MHEIVRDALDHDLRWRDAEAYVDLHGRIRAIIVGKCSVWLVQRSTPPRWICSICTVLEPKRRPVVRLRPVATVAPATRAQRGRRRGRPPLQRGRGSGARAAARYWLGRQPHAGHVVEDGNGVVVSAAIVARIEGPADTAAVEDPFLGWIQRALHDRRPREPGETMLHQFAVDSQSPDHLGPFSNAVAGLSLRLWADPSLGWCAVSSAQEATWSPVWAYIGFERLGTCAAGGIDVAVWCRDFRRDGYVSWLDALTRNELDQTGQPAPPVASPVALAYSDFAGAVHQLLRDLHAPERLLGSPLLGSHLAGAGADPRDRADELVRRVHEALALIERRPRLATPARAVDRTYLRPAATQERAAEVLGLPFSTFRRHLRRGVEQLVEVLWTWELHGVPVGHQPRAE